MVCPIFKKHHLLIMNSKILDAICALLILLFLYTAGNKLFDYSLFVVQIRQNPMIAPYADILAWAIPIVELILVTLLLSGRYRHIGLYAALVLMVIFSVYIGIMLYENSMLPCICGGAISLLNWKQHFVFNIFYTLIAAVGVWVNHRRKKTA